MRRYSLVILLAIAIFAALPYVLPTYYLSLTTKILIFVLFAMSLDLLIGYTGLASLGHAAFFGFGGYVVGLLVVRGQVSEWIALPAGVALATALGALFAVLALRARGSYFLMITLALAQVVWGIAFGWRTLTGGDDGLPGVKRPTFIVSLADENSFYYFVLLMVGLSALALVAIVRSPFGHALRGIRESETRMLALGFNVWRHQFAAFVISAAFAGLAGCLFVYNTRFVSPDVLHVVRSAEVLIMVILGGVGTLLGPAIGAAVIILLEDFVSSLTQRWLLILGIVYVVTTLFAPRGLVGLYRDYFSRNRKR
ncbi:branched-chain amino acid ABC transporter permease [Roseiarcaceae bacterium H3SJ34-1]|uniref:branched-chain amino acid ABC transporter permease n=1 Tax=Terripilifer ovatus TaxID=3032367 RepID=UPI003AB97654|nr:branched-chain amino acid ABC transporter permease [Roseiarcaceae bacterium H3SJ34-1]